MKETRANKQSSSPMLNRELSLLAFQARVLEEAQDENNPLLERIKFLSIFGSNMDELFMVRVSGLRKQVESRISEVSADGLTPREQLSAIRKRALELYKSAHSCYHRDLHARLDKEGIHILGYKKLNDSQRKKVDDYFSSVIFPILTPLALDPGHPFPHISNLSLNLAIVIRNARGEEKFARLKVPATLPALILVRKQVTGTRKDGSIVHHHYFIWLNDLIIGNLGMLFPGMEVVEAYPFRVIRDADIEIQELEAEDLLESMKQSIRRRKFGSVVMTAVQESMPKQIRNLLCENLELKSSDLYAFSGKLDLSSLMQIYNQVDRFDLKYPAYRSALPILLSQVSSGEEFFEVIRESNILLHHPYDSFNPIVDFLNMAARDPKVLAIKQTLYRVGQNSPIVDALLEASERGKQVAVLVELKARFDEESNISWAHKLEKAGVHVVYGLLGLKTHSKTGMVIRREGEGIRRYLHLATGNYNPITANFYEDVGLFTCDEVMAADVTDLFNYLTGYSSMNQYRKLLVAPFNLRQKLEILVRREMEHMQNKRPGHVIIKVNSLVDADVINLLYEASQAGVKIDLIVRGICCLVPGVERVSENIRVVSIVGRFLEHSRIFYFRNDGREEVYLGSADLMTRNLSHRVETVFPLEDPRYVRYIRDDVLDTYLRDNTNARIMQPDGSYVRAARAEGEPAVDVQQLFINYPHGFTAIDPN